MKRGSRELTGDWGTLSTPQHLFLSYMHQWICVALCNPTKQLSPRAPVPYLTFGSHGWRRKIMVQIFGSQISHGCTARSKGCSDPNPPSQPAMPEKKQADQQTCRPDIAYDHQQLQIRRDSKNVIVSKSNNFPSKRAFLQLEANLHNKL